MVRIGNFLTFSIIFYSSNFLVSVDSQSCKTSTGQPGTCVLIARCRNHPELGRGKNFYSSFDYTLSYYNYLYAMRRDFCGNNYFNPKVCCPVSQTEKPQSGTVAPKQFVIQKIKKTPPADADEKTRNQTKIDELQSLLPAKCNKRIYKRITGGEAMQLNEFPWLALLEYKKASSTLFGCTGSLISKRYIITAGHCVRNVPENWQLTHVILGEYDTKTKLDCEPRGERGLKCGDLALKVPIEQKIVHENFWIPKNYANDIALLRLSRDVPTTEYIQPICLAQSPELANSYWAAGWGETETRNQSSIKLKVSLPLFNFTECAKIYATQNITLGDGQLCAGGVPGKDTCSGDSGSPLVRLVSGTWVVDGIVSMGHRPCGVKKFPAVYTKIVHYYSWILNKLKP